MWWLGKGGGRSGRDGWIGIFWDGTSERRQMAQGNGGGSLRNSRTGEVRDRQNDEATDVTPQGDTNIM